MKEAKVSSEFKTDIVLVWEKLTNHEDFRWREGIRESVKIDENSYYEIDINGQRTDYKILEKIPMERLYLSMENKKTKSTVDYTFHPLEAGCEVKAYQKTEFKDTWTGLFAGSFIDIGKLQLRYFYLAKKSLHEL